MPAEKPRLTRCHATSPAPARPAGPTSTATAQPRGSLSAGPDGCQATAHSRMTCAMDITGTHSDRRRPSRRSGGESCAALMRSRLAIQARRLVCRSPFETPSARIWRPNIADVLSDGRRRLGAPWARPESAVRARAVSGPFTLGDVSSESSQTGSRSGSACLDGGQVLLLHAGRDPPASTDRDAVRLGPPPYLAAALPSGRRPRSRAGQAAARLARVVNVRRELLAERTRILGTGRSHTVRREAEQDRLICQAAVQIVFQRHGDLLSHPSTSICRP